MGFLDHLFKPKQSEEKVVEGGKGAAEKNGDGAGGSPDPGSFLHPKNFAQGGAGILRQPLRPAPPQAARVLEKKPAGAEPRQEIVLTLGDVLSRVPTQFLHAGLHDATRELRFSIDDLSADIARGRAAMPLSKIAALFPDVFVRPLAPADDVEIRLPLQKLVEQIGLLRGRPAVPVPLVFPADSGVPPVKESPPPDDPATSEAMTAPGELAALLAQAEDQSTAPAALPEPAPPATDEPPDGPPDPAEVAAQTPPITVGEPAPDGPSARSETTAPPAADPAVPALPAFQIFTPPPPAIAVAATPAESAAPHFEKKAAESVAPAAAEETTLPDPAPAAAAPVIRVQPPPVVRPVRVHPPPILTPSVPPVSSEPSLRLEATLAPDAPDIAALSRQLAALPGVRACALDWGGKTAFAGEPPPGFDLAALRAAAAQCTAAARALGPLPLGGSQSCTLHGDQAAISLFTRPGLLLAVFHDAFPSGIRERLATAADELSRP